MVNGVEGSCRCQTRKRGKAVFAARGVSSSRKDGMRLGMEARGGDRGTRRGWRHEVRLHECVRVRAEVLRDLPYAKRKAVVGPGMYTRDVSPGRALVTTRHLGCQVMRVTRNKKFKVDCSSRFK